MKPESPLLDKKDWCFNKEILPKRKRKASVNSYYLINLSTTYVLLLRILLYYKLKQKHKGKMKIVEVMLYVASNRYVSKIMLLNFGNMSQTFFMIISHFMIFHFHCKRHTAAIDGIKISCSLCSF